MMEYKGYVGVIEFDAADQTFHGRVANIRDVVTFEGNSVKALRQAFRDSVDDYLAFCRERGERPEKPYSGKFVARLTPDLHRRASLAAAKAGVSLNSWLANVVEGVLGFAASKRNGAKSANKRTPRVLRRGAV